MARIASLVPSGTELIAALGCESDLVARSHRCNYPPSVQDRPVVTVSKFAGRGWENPSAIDAVVDDHRHGTGSLFRVLTEELRKAKPDVLLTQSICEVCAVPKSMSVDAMDQLDTKPELIALSARTMDDVFASLHRLGQALGKEDRAREVVAGLQERVERVLRRRPTPPRPPKVVCLEWTDPLRYHGLWIPEFIGMLGAEDPFGRPSSPGGRIEWDQLLEYEPEILIVSPCGRSVPEIEKDMVQLVRRAGWNQLPAVRQDRVYLLDGEISSRHGPRVVRALELLAKIIYPKAYHDWSWTSSEVVQFLPRKRGTQPHADIDLERLRSTPGRGA